MIKQVLLLTPLILSQVLSLARIGNGNYNPSITPSDDKDATCKKLAEDVITCSIENDYSPEIGFAYGGRKSLTCIEASADALDMCGGSVAFTEDSPVFAPPYAAAGGVTASGSLYAYYESVEGGKIGSITCKDCFATLKKLLQCVLPYEAPNTDDEATAVGDPATAAALRPGMSGPFGACALELTSEKDLFALEFCAFGSAFTPVPNMNDEIDYVVEALSLGFGDLVEFCPSVEGYAHPSGKVVVKSLKSNVRAGRLRAQF